MCELNNEVVSLVSDWFFSSKDISNYDENDQKVLELAKFILLTHGAGGKFAETLVQHTFGLSVYGGIHDWDGVTASGRYTEIKLETVNDSKKLNAEGSFGEHRKNSVLKSELFLKERPFLINVGVCRDSGKCIYLMTTDTEKLPNDCLLFTRLSAKSPRTSLSHFVEHKDAYMFNYVNRELVYNNAKDISTKLYSELKRQWTIG